MNFLYNNFIADFFHMLLEFLYTNLISNYIAIAIIVIFALKIALIPVDLKQRESSMKMMKIQPKVADIRKRYPDPMQQNKKIQELYAKEQVKMTAGCLPSIIQLIVLIAFFGALQQIAYGEIIKLVQTAAANPNTPLQLEGFLWVKNIWQADSGAASVMPTLQEWSRIVEAVSPEIRETIVNIDYMAVIQPTLDAYEGSSNGWYILPIIQGVSMYFSMGYSMSHTAPADNPMSGPLMKVVMAGMTTWFCLTSNIVFVIYWITTNLIMFIQTYGFKKYFDSKEKKSTSME